ncbi:hypothetical protein BDF14DRAFT_1744883 [Spinellus fusiger]|nr:hypothetical protein BDF14DRAFT_1744883 [Spinellus fusiger]
MASSFKTIEPFPSPIIHLEDPAEYSLLADVAGCQSLPLIPRLLPAYQQHSPLQNYCSLAQVLRYQVSHNSLSRTTPALTLVDNRGKETSSIHWEKLLARAEKVAKVIQEKSSVQPGECIALMYRKSEAIEFTVALLGCFLAGRVAVPVNASTELVELVFVLTVSSSRLVLTTDQNLKAFTKDMQARQVEFPKNIEWWKTNDFGSWYPSQKTAESPDIKVSELAYIEYVKAANGELKGVAMTHKALMAQCRVYQTAVTETIPNPNLTSQHYDQGESFVPSSPLLPVVDCVVTYLEPRQQVGLILSIFCSVFAGNHTIFANVSIMETPAVWIYVLSKYKATIALADYVGLKLAVEQYQANPKEVYTHSKKVAPDLSSLRFLMVDTTIVDPELNEVIAESLLRPLGVKNNPLQIVCPLLSLPEYGGMIVSFRDYLGAALLEEFVADDGPENEEVDGDHPKPPVFRARSALASGHSRDVWECVLDASALRNNKVVVLAAGSGSQIAEHMNEPGAVRMGSFGFVLPQATVAIVDPETTALCAPDTIGEVWIDAPSVPGGFWGLPGHTDAIFHARPIVVSSESCSLEAYHQEFLRTGLIGKMIGGRLVVFGTYEDRIRQQRLGEGTGCNETHFSNNLVETIRRNSSIEACVFFDIMVNSQLLPVLVFESSASREELANLVSNVMEIILAFHGLRLYAAIAVAPRTLPRAIKHNRRQVHALMAKRAFLFGQLSPRFVKMDVDRTIFSVATSLDLYQDIWRSSLAYEKAISMNIVSTRPHPQHTGMEAVQIVLDERTDCDLSKFANIVDLFLWRASLHPDETAFIGLTQATGPLVTKSYTWRKISTKIAAIASHLRKKVKLARHDKILLLIPFGLDFIITLYACLTLGVVVVPCPPPDPEQHPQRIGEDVTNMFAVLSDLNISAILTNGKGEDIMKSKHVSPVLKQAMSVRKSNFKMPEQHSVNKAAKFNKMLGKESGLIIPSEWAMDTSPVLISVQYSVDMRRIYTTLGHNTILAQCRTQKMTCQMKFQRSLVAAGCPTVLLSDEDFYTNPIAYFELVQRYKAKDACISHPLLQYVMNRANQADLRRIVLHNVQNLMITTEDRAKPTLYQHMVKYFSPCRLEKEAISTVYSHIANPMITTRSYMLVEPISLFVDASWLRQGIVRPTPAEDGQSMLLHDSGIVPSNTMVAIINPETNMLCPDNIIGEIWVSSDCNIQSYYGMDEANHCARFEATIAGSDPRIKYMRTGDLGFLWNVQRQINGRNMVEEGQCLFVLGPMSETIKVNRLLYFPADIEHSVERCHPTIPPGGCHVFQTNSEVVAVVAVKSKEHALAIVPLVVNAVLENHTFLVDTIVVVSSQQLPRSRYGDKLRGKTLASFVEQKLKTALYVSRITNQHQPLMLPQWHQSQGVYDDNMSITSGYAPQMGGPYTSYENNDSVDRQSIDQLRRVDTARSYRTQSSTGADSIPATIM